MAEKKTQEDPIPEDQPSPAQESADKPKDMPGKQAPDKTTTTVPIPPVPPTTVSPRILMPGFTKTSPNDLYRRLLPAVLFVLTFVTVMTMLLIYMDTVALGAQKFRANMSRDYELASIPQGSAALVAFVQQLHLAPRHAPAKLQPPSAPTLQVELMDKLYGETYNSTFVEFVPRGPRAATGLYLEAARGWAGVLVRAAARDFLALRGNARALHACLSPAPHPREVTYQETESQESVFSSRVLCLPLLTVLLAADATDARHVLLGGENVLPALRHLPFDDERVHLPIIEVQFTDAATRNHTTHFLATKRYSVAGTFDGSVMYKLNERPV